MMMKITQIALANPPRSWLRKMSPKTMISSQIQMKNMKNQSIDQKTWPVPKSEASVTYLSSFSRPALPWPHSLA